MRSVYSYNSSFLLSRRSVVCGILHLMSDAVFVIVLYRSLARSHYTVAPKLTLSMTTRSASPSEHSYGTNPTLTPAVGEICTYTDIYFPAIHVNPRSMSKYSQIPAILHLPPDGF